MEGEVRVPETGGERRVLTSRLRVADPSGVAPEHWGVLPPLRALPPLRSRLSQRRAPDPFSRSLLFRANVPIF